LRGDLSLPLCRKDADGWATRWFAGWGGRQLSHQTRLWRPRRADDLSGDRAGALRRWAVGEWPQLLWRTESSSLSSSTGQRG